LEKREQGVDAPERLGGLRDARRQFFFYGPGRFRPQQIHAADSQLRQDGDAQYDDAHTSEPLRQRTPEQQCGQLTFRMRQYGGAGRRESRGRLEQCVNREPRPFYKQVGHRTDDGSGDPGCGDEDECLSPAELESCVLVEQLLQDQAGNAGQGGGDQKSMHAIAAQVVGDARRHQ